MYFISMLNIAESPKLCGLLCVKFQIWQDLECSQACLSIDDKGTRDRHYIFASKTKTENQRHFAILSNSVRECAISLESPSPCSCQAFHETEEDVSVQATLVSFIQDNN